MIRIEIKNFYWMIEHGCSVRINIEHGCSVRIIWFYYMCKYITYSQNLFFLRVNMYIYLMYEPTTYILYFSEFIFSMCMYT